MDLKTLLTGGTTTFRRDAMTPELEARAQAAEGGQGVAELVSALVVDWDLTEGGEPYPVTPENVRRLPYTFLIAVTQEITKEVASDPSLSGTSDAPS